MAQDAITHHLTRIKAKLALLRERDSQFHVSGSLRHRYQLRPCLSDEQLRTIETAHQISLPQGYRRFLMEIGNGGAGPRSGVFSLEWSLHGVPSGCLRHPFPFRHAYHPLTDPPLSTADVPIEASLKATIDQDIARLVAADPSIQLRLEFGCLTIAAQGCGMYDHVVLTGRERGHMWGSDWGNDGGMYPMDRFATIQTYAERPARVRVTFLKWYEGWLDDGLAQVRATAL